MLEKQMNPNWKGGKDIKCLICENFFWVKPSHILKRKCCSVKCRDLYWKQTGRYLGEKNPAFGAKKITLKCFYCNKLFTRLVRLLPKGKDAKIYCSRRCSLTVIGKRQKTGKDNPNYGNGFKIMGENNPNWRGGKTAIIRQLRGTKEYARWRKIILAKFNYTCCFCGSKEQIETDHIVPISQDISRALDIDNGRVLCKLCHRKTSSYGVVTNERK